MKFRRRKGFTLIELLVVIAIIGILAAMVFPVFARARESARKAVCLANVKNLSLAFQMYFLDNDDIFLTLEHRPEVRSYFDNTAGVLYRGAPRAGCKQGTYYANPYLRAPVILDEYTRSRSLWNCPNAKLIMGAQVINGCVPNWLEWQKAMDVANGGSNTLGPCHNTFPKGWGGTVTDSLIQRQLANFANNSGGAWGAGDSAKNAFMETIAVMDKIEAPRSYEPITDPSKYAIIGDGGNIINELDIGCVAFADICAPECQNFGAREAGCVSSDNYIGDTESAKFNADPGYRKQFARHLGGTNVGFRDGHAAWFDSEKLIDMFLNNEIRGINDEEGFPISKEASVKASEAGAGWGVWSYTAADPCGFTDYYPGTPTLR